MASVTVSSPLMANSSHSATGNHIIGVPTPLYVVVQRPAACNAISAETPKNMGVSEIQELAKKYSEKCSLNINVIDDTALIDTSAIGKGKFNGNFQESGKEKKKAKRRGKKSWKKKKNVDECCRNQGSVEKKETVMVYSREEMVAMRFEGLEDQKKKWAEVYSGLGASVAAEYDGLVYSADFDKKRGVSSFGFDRRPFFKKPANLDAVAAMGKRNHLNIFVH